MDSSKIRNPNIALLEQRRALRTLHALDVAEAALDTPPTDENARIEAQSAHERIETFRKIRLRRVRP